MKLFHCELQVRGYEIDGYGHVNNAVYLNYAEFARWRMIETAHINEVNYFKKHNLNPIVVRVEIDYKAPCFLAEWLTVETSLVKLRKRVAHFKQVISKRDSKTVAAELVVYACVVNKSGKAVSLPSDFEQYFGGVHDIGQGE